jgi:predicted CXXCH cytochrome family protein
MKKALIILIALTLVAGVASAGVVGSKHDLSTTGGTAASDATRVCVFCHTPHQATAAAGQYPLWNHTLSGAGPYASYSSATIDVDDLTDIPVAVAGSASTSNLCLSCHDGTVSVISLYNEPNEGALTLSPIAGIIDGTGKIISNANIGTSLSNDHPVNFTYDADLIAADPDFNPVATVDAAGLLDPSDKVQCSSCHDPHDDTYAGFMIMDNTNSALCTTCHRK